LGRGVNTIHKANWVDISPRWALIAILSWLFLSAGVACSGQFYIDHARKTAIDAAFAQADAGAEVLEHVARRVIGEVEHLQSLIQMRENLLLQGHSEAAAAIAETLRGAVASQKSDILEISAVGPDGRTLWATGPSSDAIYDLRQVPIDPATDLGLHLDPPGIDRASGRWSIQLARRLVSPDGTVGGAAIVTLDLLKLSATLAGLQLNRNGVSALLTMQDGRLVAGSRDAQSLPTNQPPLANPSNSTFNPHPIPGANSDGSHRTVRTMAGHLAFESYRPVGQLPLLAIVSLDGDTALSGTQRLARWIRITVAAFAALLGAALAVLIGSRTRGWPSMELALAQQRSKLTEEARIRISQLLSGLPAAIYAITLAPDGRVVDFTMTDTAQRLTGWEESELASRHAWVSRAFGIDEFDWLAYYRKVMMEGDAVIEYRFLFKDGSMAWLRDQARVIGRDENGQVSVVGYISDITRERAVQAQAFASSKLATLGEMAVGLAHELNQPISTMSLAAENAEHMLEQKGADGIAFALQRMSRIVDQAKRARTIINHLRIFGRQSGEETGPVPLKTVIEGALAMVGSALRSTGIIVEVRLPDALPSILAQPILAEHVIVNLLLNARDAMETNPIARPRDLTISAEFDDRTGMVTLSVQDTGPGIPVHLIDRIFEPFFTTKEAGKGTGLGLSLCHGIMTSFDGGITVKNRPGGGAVFLTTFRTVHAQSQLTIEPESPVASAA
jgi:PAS domain S-box-containing protein